MEEVIIPMPDHDSIPVGKIDVNSSDDLGNAVKAFLKGGGKIRKFRADVVTDLLEGHPLQFEEVVNPDEVQEQIFGKIQVK